MFNSYFTVVYTRSINDPLYAIKLIGRPGHTNIAVLSAQDENSPGIVPFEESSEFVALGRTRSNLVRIQQTFGEGTYLGGIVTNRVYEVGGSGSVAGVDGRLRLSQNYALEGQILATRTIESGDSTLTAHFTETEFDGGKHTAAYDGEDFWGRSIYASFERNARRWSFDLDYWDRSPTFRVDNGFEPRNDQRIGLVNTGYTIWFPERSLIEWVEPSIDLGRQWNFRNVKKDEWIRANLSLRLKWAQLQLHGQHLASNELFGGIQFDGIYEWHICAQSNPSDLFQFGFNFNHGHRIARRFLVMGQERRFGGWLDLKPVDRLLLETWFDYAESRSLDTGEELFSGYVSRGKLSLQLTRELSLRLIVQYDDFARIWAADPLMTYQINPFSIFYIGSTRSYANVAFGEDSPGSWRLVDRTYFLKLQYLIQL